MFTLMKTYPNGMCTYIPIVKKMGIREAVSICGLNNCKGDEISVSKGYGRGQKKVNVA